MKNLPKALTLIKDADIRAIFNYADELQSAVIQDAFDFARECQRGRFLDEDEWEDACQTADAAQDAGHYAAAPFRWIAFYSDVERASELFGALAEGWRRMEDYFGEEWDALLEAQQIMASMGGAA